MLTSYRHKINMPIYSFSFIVLEPGGDGDGSSRKRPHPQRKDREVCPPPLDVPGGLGARLGERGSVSPPLG